MSDAVYRREAAFHDRWAAGERADALDAEAHFTAITAPENRYILRKLGDLRGKRVLDVGGGLGENAVFFARRGARVTASDIAPGMVAHALEACRLAGHDEVEGRVLNAMHLDLPDACYDIVYAANILHHTPDPVRAMRELRRVTRPGGLVCTWDPLCHNPVINAYRRMATAVRSDDERPLRIEFLDRIRPLFRDLRVRTFWIATLWIFLRFYLIERVHPNDDRYWKRIIRDHRRVAPCYRRLARLDALLTRLPGLRRWAWNLVIVARR